MKIQFEAGEGRHFQGGVNFLISDNHTVYAEMAVPDGASDDYGYLTMKNALLATLPKEVADSIVWWYDEQSERNLAPDASAKGEMYIDLETE